MPSDDAHARGVQCVYALVLRFRANPEGRANVPRFSIVIPVLGDPQQFEPTLVSVLENRPEDCQIVLALNRPYDDPYQLEGEVEFVRLPRKAGWADELNAAWAVCRAEIVAVLACGAEVAPGWTEAALSAFDDPLVTSAAPLIVHDPRPAEGDCRPADLATHPDHLPHALPTDDQAPADILSMVSPSHKTVVSMGLGCGLAGEVYRLAEGQRPDALRPSFRPIGPDPLAGFFRRRAVEIVGGWTALGGPTLCHADLALRLQAMGSRCAPLPANALRFCRAAQENEHPLSRGWHAERFFWRWRSQQARWTGTAAHLGLGILRAAAGIVRPSLACEMLGRMAAIAALPWSQLSPRAIDPAPFADDTPSAVFSGIERRAA